MPSIPGRIIRAWREEMEFSPHDLCLACNFTIDYLNRIEEDAVDKVHTRTYQKIANAFNLTLDELSLDPDEVRRGDIILEAPEQFHKLLHLVVGLVVLLGTLTLIVLCTALLSYGFLRLYPLAEDFFVEAPSIQEPGPPPHPKTDTPRLGGPDRSRA